MTKPHATEQLESTSGNGDSASYLALQALSSRIHAVHEIAAAMNRTLQLSEIIDVVKQQSKWLLDFDYGALWLDDQETELWDAASVQLQAEERHFATRATVTLRQLVTEKRSLQSFNRANAERLLGARASWLAAPLLADGDVLGGVLFCSQQLAQYSAEDLRIANLLAMQLTNAVRNAAQFTEISKLYNRLTTTLVELQRAEQARMDLSRMIIHDLRTPLSVINISLELMEEVGDAHDQPSAVRNLQRARKATDEMRNLISDLLEITRLNEAKVPLVMERIEIAALVTALVADWQPQVAAEQKRLVNVVPDNLPVLHADSRLLKRVFDNLISNALKFTTRGDEVSISARQLNGVIQFAVKDTGLGIAPAEQNRIFEQFVQITDAAGKPLRNGNGIGLAFCRLALQAHQGAIWVESQPEQGSTFHFTLPLRSAGYLAVGSKLSSSAKGFCSK